MLIALTSLLFLIIATYNLRWASLILIAALPSYLWRFQIGSLPSTFLEVMILIIFFAFLARGVLKHYPRIDIKFLKPHNNVETLLNNVSTKNGKLFLFFIFTFLIAATISIFISPDKRAALGLWKAYFIEPIILFFIFSALFAKKDIPKIIWALAISALSVAGLAMIQKSTGWLVPYSFWGKDEIFRVTSFYGFPNAISLYLAPIIPLLLFYIFKKLHEIYNSAKDRYTLSQKNIPILILFLLITISSCLAIIWAQTTGALIGIFGGALFVALFYRKFRIPAMIIICAIIGILFTQMVPEEIYKELVLKDWSGQVRIQMWGETWHMLTANWQNALLGVGLSAYPIAIAPFHVWDFVEIFQYPHNILFNFWSEIGLLGLFSFAGLCFLFYKKIFWHKKKRHDQFCAKLLKLCLAWSFSIILIHGLVDVHYFKNDLAVLFWVLFLILSLTQKNEHERHVSPTH